MKHLFIAVSFFYCSISFGQFDKIDHLVVASPNAEQLYKLFKDAFQLPVLFNYQTFGSFSSGGLSLGNVTIEFGTAKNITRTAFDAIAVEPHETAERTLTNLDLLDIPHGSINPYVTTFPNGARDTVWKTATLAGPLFICDYSHRDEVHNLQKRMADSLQLRQGGPLGIIKLKEIVVGGEELTRFSNEFLKFPGQITGNDSLIQFSSGPSIRLVKRDHLSIEKIIIHVNSISRAKNYLQQKGLLGSASGDSVFIEPGAISGLSIELMEK
jgi:hypothetical protein